MASGGCGAMEGEFREAVRDGLLHGVVVALGTADSLPLIVAMGDAAVAPERVPMRADAMFDIASVTKAVATASACGLCIDDGLIDPEAPATDYLPELGTFAGVPPRVHQLATHYSGIDNRKFDELAPEAMLESMVTTPVQWMPGERFEYSCRNYVLLGLLVERVTGEGLGSFCQRRLFGPLGMADTAFGPLHPLDARVVPSSVSPGIISDEQARQAGRPTGNAGLFSTAEDLWRFCRMILNGGWHGEKRILGERALAWLLLPCNPPGLPRRSFGWDMRTREESPCRPALASPAAIGHSGHSGQSVWIDPEQGVCTIVLTNRTHCPKKSDNYLGSKEFRSKVADWMIRSRG